MGIRARSSGCGSRVQESWSIAWRVAEGRALYAGWSAGETPAGRRRSEIIVPLRWYPRLLNARAEQRHDYRLIGDGEYIHWPQIDEDLTQLLRGTPAPRTSDV